LTMRLTRKNRGRIILFVLLTIVLYLRLLNPDWGGFTPPLNPSSPPSPAEAVRCIPSTPAESAELVRVIDGDTIDVRLASGEVQRVRFIGIDTPERGEPFYREASQINEALLRSGKLILHRDVSQTDRFDRLLRYVLAGDVFVNYELVKQGYAQSATFPPDVACADTFLRAQQDARQARRGLWADSFP
jgi:micrococcal nuclease